MLKIAFIGCGNNGLSHAAIFKNNPSVIPVAGADPCDKQLIKFKEISGDVRCYQDYRQLLAQETIDIVCISTPHKFHYEQAKASLEKGCHVLLEKPIALKEEECKELIKTAQKKKLLFQVGFECRKSALYSRIKDIIESGEIGQLNSISFHHTRGAWVKEWYCKKEFAGNSIAIIETCHYIDLMRFWSGDEIEWVFASVPSRNLRLEYEYPDTSFCQLGFKSGIIGNIVDSHAVASDQFDGHSINTGQSYATIEAEYMEPVYGHRFEYTIVGTKGTLVVNMFAKKISVMSINYVGDNGRAQIGLKRIEDYSKQPLLHLVHDYSGLDNAFIDCIQNNKPEVFSSEDALRTHQVVFAIEKSESLTERVNVQY